MSSGSRMTSNFSNLAQEREEAKLEEELAKQKQAQQRELAEAQKRKQGMLRRQISAGGGSLIPAQNKSSTLGG